ncbi:S-adenosylmethionine decarboxylase related protein [Fictibacillus iocasae]|uniref:S-adenosylmethionine decarboxylase related protein n=1 Tax=Fictibacillus iocasae TaxID=2715437 RepID=A0ABW2NQ72_9BACL
MSTQLTILGSGGGVAKAILSILNQAVQDGNDPLHHTLQQSTFHLIDMKQKDTTYYERRFPHLTNQIKLYEFNLQDIEAFKHHLKTTQTSIVVDVSWADTIQMLTCCNEFGVSYINSALENTAVDDDPTLYGFPLSERFKRFEEVKQNFTNTKAIIGSGMNPGVVQWMAHELLQKHKKDKPKACYIVEHDTSFFADDRLVKKDTIYTSWSVECFLDEAILSYPMYVANQVPLYLYEDVYRTEYSVTLGDVSFKGCLMPHEEVLSLGKLYDMEFGFIYRVNEHTTNLIRDNLHRVDELWDWEHQLIDPDIGPVHGEDLVGVLLVFEDREEYVYNVMNTKEIYHRYQTNATYFQVACGLYGGLASLLLDPVPNGAHYVDELLLQHGIRYGSYLSCHMRDFVTGTNTASDGLLHNRRKRV